MKKNNATDKFSYITLGELTAYAINDLNAKIAPLQKEKEEFLARLENETDKQIIDGIKKLIENCDAMMLPWKMKREAAANLYKITTGEDFPAEF